MNKTQILMSGLKKCFLAASVFIIATGCAEDEIFEQATPAVQHEAPIEFVEESDVSSVTISGIYTDVVDVIDCATCTYTVADNATVVDGTELKIKPGSVVCLGNGRKLGEVEFVNMIGTEDRPITIGTCPE